MVPDRARTRIGVDIGGTFTDPVWVDEATGAVRVGKLLTTPKEHAQAVEERESTAVIGPRARVAVDDRLDVVAEPAR